MRLFPVPLAVLATVAFPWSHAELSAQGVHTDPVSGCKIKPPPSWVCIGQGKDLGQNGPVFAAPRHYAPTKTQGPAHTPTMRVLFFRKQAAAPAPASASALPMRTPYRDFADYLGRVHGVGGKEQSSEVEKIGKLAGVVTVSEVPLKTGPLTLHAFRFQRDDGEVVVEFEALSEQYEKLRSTFEKSVKTFVDGPPEADASEAKAPLWETDAAAWRALAAADRSAQRAKYGEDWLDKRLAQRIPGQTSKKIDGYVIESRADAKFTQRVAEAAPALRAWVEARFAGVSDEVVMPAAIRLFEDDRELSALRLREVVQRPYDPDRREIYFAKDDRFGTTGEDYGILMRGILEHFLHDKHPGIVDRIPRWLDHGMSRYFRSSRYKKKKLEFFASPEENARLLYYQEHKDGGYVLPNIWELIQESIRPSPENGEPEKPWDYVTECSRALRWLDAGGSQLMGHENFVMAYYQAIAKCAETQPPDPAKDVYWERLDDKQTRDLRKRQYEWRDKLLVEINALACNLKEAEWEKANAAWKKFNEDWKE